MVCQVGQLQTASAFLMARGQGVSAANPQFQIWSASRTRNSRRRVAKSAPAHLMARVLGVKPAAVAGTTTKRSVSETEREDKAEDGSEDGFGPLLGALLID